MGRRLDRPIRLYVLAIFIVVAYGVMPLISVFPFGRGFLLIGPIILPFNGSVQFLYDSNGDAPFVLVFISLFLGMFSGFAAVVAFLGSSFGRILALIFATLDVV